MNDNAKTAILKKCTDETTEKLHKLIGSVIKETANSGNQHLVMLGVLLALGRMSGIVTGAIPEPVRGIAEELLEEEIQIGRVRFKDFVESMNEAEEVLNKMRGAND